MNIIKSLKARLVALLANKAVQSVLRHAAIAGGAVLLPVLFSGTPISVALVVSAGAAALRVVWIAVQSRLMPPKAAK